MQVYRYDDKGRFIEPVLIELNENDSYDIPNDCTDVELPQPNWKPVFDKEKNKWVETITQEELDEMQAPKERTLTDLETLGQQMTEREIEAIVQGQSVTDLEIESMLQGQTITDLEIQSMEQEQLATEMELRLLGLEAKVNV